MQIGVPSRARMLKVVTVSPLWNARSNGQRSVLQISVRSTLPHERRTHWISDSPARVWAGSFSASRRRSWSIVMTESGMLRRMSRTFNGSVQIGIAVLGRRPVAGDVATACIVQHGAARRR
jgi:hypothetical protein